MIGRLGIPGTLAALVFVGCVAAAIFQGSMVAIFVAVPAGIFTGVRFFYAEGA
jgi:hypothetical protein